MTISAKDFTRMADSAYEMAQSYIDMAASCPQIDPRRDHYLKLANDRYDDGDFYVSRATMAEADEFRRACQDAQKEAAE